MKSGKPERGVPAPTLENMRTRAQETLHGDFNYLRTPEGVNVLSVRSREPNSQGDESE